MNNNILGIFNRSIDSKYRIILPKVAGIEEKEELVIIQRQDYFEIKESKTIINQLKNLDMKIENTDNIEKIELYRMLKDEITSFIAGTITRDSKGRTIIGKYIIEKYELKDEVVIEGIMDGLRVWNPSKFNEHQESIMKKNRIK